VTASYNGWAASRTPADIGVIPFVVNGVPFPGGVRSGDVETVFRHLVEQFARRVEALVTPGCWGYYYKQSANSVVLLSCHSSGTAIDVNAPRHPNGKRGTFTAAQVAQIRAILAELSGVVYWGGDAWGDGTPDEMHFEIKTGVTAAQVAAAARKLTHQEDPMAALSDDEQRRLLANTDLIVAQLAGDQYSASGGKTWGWPNLVDGKRQTVVDLLREVHGELKRPFPVDDRPRTDGKPDTAVGWLLNVAGKLLRS
jgi:hypothetical protein